MKKSLLKIMTLLILITMLISGCGDKTEKPPVEPTQKPSSSSGSSGTAEKEQTDFTGSYSPTPLNNSSESAEAEGSCVPIQQPTGAPVEIKSLIPLKSATFDDANDVKDTEWKRFNDKDSVKLSISDDGFVGKCLYFTKDDSESASYHTAMIDIQPYITQPGDYTIKFKFKVIGADGANNVFAGVIRTNAKTSFTPERKNNTQTYCGTGSATPVEDDTWYLYTGQVSIALEDIEAGGQWRFGLQSIQEGVSEVFIDEVELNPLTYVADAQPVTSARTWIANEVVLKSSKEYKDPFNDVDVDLVLTNGNVTYTIPGFWDGGTVWRVRFVCPTEGTWTYTTQCTDKSNTGLHNQKSTIECTKYKGNLEVYKRGFVKTQENTKYFTYADGTPFFYLGDTHWGLGRENLDMVKETVKTRAKQGYTVYQSEPIGVGFDFTDGVTTADIAGFKANDQKFQAVANYGLVHANASHFFPDEMQKFIDNFGGYSTKVAGFGAKKNKTVTFYEISDDVKQALEKICRYWVARYSAYPVMWTLAQEVDNDNFWTEKSDFHKHEFWGYANNPYIFVAEYMAKYDPYKSPLTAHQEGSSMTQASNSAFRNVEAHTWYGSQWKPSKTGDTKVLFDVAKDYWEKGQGKPCVNYESHYCMLETKNFGARAQGWFSFLSGFCGYGYGAQGGWLYNGSYVADQPGDDGVDIVSVEQKAAGTKDWKGALKLESSIQMGYMRRFFEEKVVDWNKLIPRFTDTDYLERDTGALGVMASTEDGSKAVIYFYSFSDATVGEKPNAKNSGTKTGIVKKLEANAEYHYVWFNPIKGKITESGTFNASAEGQWQITEKATTDMVLYIYK
ncbi:MAG: DUF4038 domain-containing protein [Clostridiales bacterium]|nr:DUF4038 domain-containing protein [Clostridiales bacterium]